MTEAVFYACCLWSTDDYMPHVPGDELHVGIASEATLRTDGREYAGVDAKARPRSRRTRIVSSSSSADVLLS